MANKRPAFTQNELHTVITGLRAWEHTGTKRRTKAIRKLLRDYVNFVVATGCRPGTELRDLRWTDIDQFDDKTGSYLHIHVNGKTGARSLIASTRLQRYLDRLKRRQTTPTPYVFALPDGTRPKDLHGAFEQYLQSIGLLYNKQGNRYSLYSLRHNYATKRLVNGVNMHVLARQMGTSTQMLERHYSHVSPMMNAKALA
jgi:integrase